MTNTDTPIIGRHLLDTITTGMYSNPYCIFREYIQNSADAIDKAVLEGTLEKRKGEIRITLEPQEKTITILDNGCGVPSVQAKQTLMSIGNSGKHNTRERGFRGIGRLGGTAYCNTLVFSTKACGEDLETVITWDCKKMKELQIRSNTISHNMELKDLILKCITVETRNSERNLDESFFQVEMLQVRCTKNMLFDFPKVRQYIEETAPVPFNEQQFYFGKDIDEWLIRVVPSYCTYRIFLNNELIMKRYGQELATNGKQSDKICEIKKIDILDKSEKAIAYGWLGIREQNIGAIMPSSGVDSLRVRVGNILLGNSSLLDRCFRDGKDQRFNGYLVGEIHIVAPELIPNGQRDDLEDGPLTTDFYEYIRCNIAVPSVRDARVKSEKKNSKKTLEESQEILVGTAKQCKGGFVGTAERNTAITTVHTQIENLQNLQQKTSISEEDKTVAEKLERKLQKQVTNIETAPDKITVLLNNGTYSKKERELLQRVFGIIQSLYDDKDSCSELIEATIKKLLKS